MKNIHLIMFMLGMMLFSGAYADDTDIYLDSGAGRSNPPYLMLMIDFTPDTGRSYCKPLSACDDLMSESAFAKLCRLYGTPPGGNPAHTESACRLLYNQLQNGGQTSQSVAGF